MRSLCHFLLEGSWILSFGIVDGLVTYRLKPRCVLTVGTLATEAVLLGREAYAVQLETLGILAGAWDMRWFAIILVILLASAPSSGGGRCHHDL